MSTQSEIEAMIIETMEQQDANYHAALEQFTEVDREFDVLSAFGQTPIKYVGRTGHYNDDTTENVFVTVLEHFVVVFEHRVPNYCDDDSDATLTLTIEEGHLQSAADLLLRRANEYLVEAVTAVIASTATGPDYPGVNRDAYLPYNMTVDIPGLAQRLKHIPQEVA